MRVGIVTGEYPPMQGGIGAYSQILARTLAKQGHDVFVLTSTQGQSDDSSIQVDNTIDRWGYGSLGAAQRWAMINRLDVLNLQFQTAAFSMSPWIHFLPDMVRAVPVITTFHDLRFPYLFPKAGPLRDWIVMRLARRSVGVIVTNHEDLARVSRLPKTTLIPIGSNILAPLPADYDREVWRKKAGTYHNELLLAHFGFVNRSKGLDVLLHGLKRLHEADIPARLMMIGGRTGTSDPTNAAYVSEIDALIARLQLTDSVQWTGFVDDAEVSAYLHAADVVALPFSDGASYRRGSLMAAIQQQCAILTTTPQVEIPTFTDGENMKLVPPGDVDALTVAMIDLRESPEMQQTLRQGAAKLKACFDWDTIARDCAAFFADVIGEKA